jgi:hypothetical protein
LLKLYLGEKFILVRNPIFGKNRISKNKNFDFLEKIGFLKNRLTQWRKYTMFFNFLKYLLLTLLLSLVACSDKEPTTVSDEVMPNKVVRESTGGQSQPENTGGQLRLEIPSLLGWGKVSDIQITMGESLELLATLEDQNGLPITNEALFVSSAKGNFFKENVLLTDHNGQARCLLVATVPGKDQITVDNNGSFSTTLSITVLDPDGKWNEDSNSLKELPGVVSWKTLAKVTLKNEKPNFDKEIEALNGQTVKIQGFMLPLEQTEKHKHFMLSVNPPSCFFCLPAGSEGLVEVYTKQVFEFSYDPIIVSGTLLVLKNDEMGLYYRMQNALQDK